MLRCRNGQQDHEDAECIRLGTLAKVGGILAAHLTHSTSEEAITSIAISAQGNLLLATYGDPV